MSIPMQSIPFSIQAFVSFFSKKHNFRNPTAYKQAILQNERYKNCQNNSAFFMTVVSIQVFHPVKAGMGLTKDPLRGNLFAKL